MTDHGPPTWARRRVTGLGIRASEEQRRLKLRRGWVLRKGTACWDREGTDKGCSLREWT